jgi:citrate lyase subunit beta/citryl-CoA lyase
MGFDASSTFYAPHVDIINAVFSPSEKELAEAREVVTEYEKVKNQGRAAYVRPDGKWITVHQFRQASETLARFG